MKKKQTTSEKGLLSDIILKGKSLPKNLRNRTLQPVADLFQRIERDVLLAQFEPVQGRIRKSGFAGILLVGEIAPPFPEERCQLLCQSFSSHDWMLSPALSHMWNICLVASSHYLAIEFTEQRKIRTLRICCDLDSRLLENI